MKDDPVTLERWDSMFRDAVPSAVAAAALVGWTPVDLEPERELVAWTDLGGVELTDPFFYQTVMYHWQRRGGPSALFTGLEALFALRDRISALEPSGFIFHVSACG